MANRFKRRLSIINEETLETSFRNKRLAGGLKFPSQQGFENSPLFDEFFIIGAPPVDMPKIQPSVLAAFPDNQTASRNLEELELIISFCFPTGFDPIPRDVNKSIVLLNEYAFYINQGNQRIYGVCVHFRALNNTLPMRKKNQRYPFCLCMLSSVPYLSCHFQFLSYLAFLLNKKVATIQHFSDLKPFSRNPSECNFEGLMIDDNHNGLAIYPGFNLSSELYHELLFYYDLPVRLNHFRRPKIDLCQKLQLYFPDHLDENACLAYPTLHVLISSLSPSQIIRIYTALLLEHRIVFHSTCLHKLSLSIIASLSLLSPFRSQSYLEIPILPNRDSFMGLLQSPVPFIAGVPIKINGAEFDMYIDLDLGKVYENVKIPAFPRSSELIHKCEMILSDSYEAIHTPQKELKSLFSSPSRNPEYDKFMKTTDKYVFPYIYNSLTNPKYVLTSTVINSILDLFGLHFAPHLEEKIRECFVTDTTNCSQPVTVCNKDLFMIMTDLKEKEFYQTFTGTGIFDDFCNKLTDDFQIKKSISMDFKMMNQEDSYSSCPTAT